MKLSLKHLVVGGLVLFLLGLVSGGVLTSLRLAQAEGQQNAPRVQPTPAVASAAMEVPGRAIPGLPRYPGSTRVEYRRTVYGNLVVTEAEYMASAETAELREFYRHSFERNGWAVVDSGIVAGEWVFVVVDVDGEREAVVEIELRGSPVNYEIKLTEPYQQPTPTPEDAG